MPAATANARAGEWTFRIAVIRFAPSEVYRLIFASRELNAATEERFRASIFSFHRARRDEIDAVRPLHIGIVTARPGDRSEGLASRMAVQDRALELFLLINGLEAGERVEAGRRYKIIAE